MLLLRTFLLVSYTLLASVFGQSSSSSGVNSTSIISASPTTATAAGSSSVPFFTIPNTFTPTASGSSAIPGSVIGITNGPYLSDTFSYTAALSTVPPTGNITNPNVPASRGGAGGTTNLSPDPTNLQTASARMVFGSIQELRTTIIVSGISGLFVTVSGLIGVGWVL